jgi:hypothetical protein
VEDYFFNYVTLNVEIQGQGVPQRVKVYSYYLGILQGCPCVLVLLLILLFRFVIVRQM